MVFYVYTVEFRRKTTWEDGELFAQEEYTPWIYDSHHVDIFDARDRFDALFATGQYTQIRINQKCVNFRNRDIELNMISMFFGGDPYLRWRNPDLLAAAGIQPPFGVSVMRSRDWYALVQPEMPIGG